MHLPTLRSPIVLVHGLLGFDTLRVGSWLNLDYFWGLPRWMTEAGNRVLMAGLSPIGCVEARAKQLKAFLDLNAPGEPVHLLAHSMGGLDSRYMITHLGMADRVLSLTTLGTPHRGTAFADWGVRRLGRLLAPIFEKVGISRQAFDDLTTPACKEFNARTPDAPGVRYFSVAGKYSPSWLNPSWQLAGPIVEREEGPCDGIVSVASAAWGEESEVWEGDHMNLVNWPQVGASAEANDRKPEYARLLGRLRDLGH